MHKGDRALVRGKDQAALQPSITSGEDTPQLFLLPDWEARGCPTSSYALFHLGLMTQAQKGEKDRKAREVGAGDTLMFLGFPHAVLFLIVCLQGNEQNCT